MGGAANPQLILQMLKSKLGGAGGPGGPGGAPGAGGEESMGPATRELQGADPDYALKLVNQLKKQIADMIPTLAFRAPAASRALVSTFKGLDAAIKELQQAQATLNAVGGPINMSAIPQPQPPGGASGAPQLPKPAGIGM
jgi:hypothetical protein